MSLLETKIPCWVFDVDGTMANGSHRQHYVREKPKNWYAYRKLAHADALIFPVAEVFRNLVKTRTKVFIFSGRSDDEREVTKNWFAGYGMNLDEMGVTMLMRPSGDSREDSIIKRELLERIRTEGYEPIGVFDDRNRVVKMWRENGVFVFHVDQTSVSEDF